MPALINGIIGESSFERVRDRIGEILATEITSQYNLTPAGINKDALNLKNGMVWVERFIPPDKNELPTVIVSLAEGDLIEQDQTHTSGVYTYNIDCYHSAKSDANERGDVKAMLKLHKLVAVCRVILENSKYKTLGFVAPFIMNRHVSRIQIREEKGSEDAVSVVMARLSFVVKVPEESELAEAGSVAGIDTVVKLYDTERGYVFSGNSFPFPEGYGGEVNLNGVFMRVVQEGESVNIIVVDEDGNQVGEKIGDNWVVPAAGADGTAVLKNSLDETISTTPIPSGQTVDITAPNVFVRVRNSQNIIVENGLAIPGNPLLDVPAPDADVTIKNTAGDTVATGQAPSGVNTDVEIPDETVNVYVNGVLNQTATRPPLSGVAINITA